MYRAVTKPPNDDAPTKTHRVDEPPATFSALPKELLHRILHSDPNWPNVASFNRASEELKQEDIARWNTIDDDEIDRIITEWVASPHEETPEMYNLVKYTVDKAKLKRSVQRIFDSNNNDGESIVYYMKNRGVFCDIRRHSEHMTAVEKFHLLLHSTINTPNELTSVLTVTHYNLETSDRVPLYALILRSMVNCNIFRQFEIRFNCNVQFPFTTCRLNKIDKQLLALTPREIFKQIDIHILHAPGVTPPEVLTIQASAPKFEGFQFRFISESSNTIGNVTDLLYNNTTVRQLRRRGPT